MDMMALWQPALVNPVVLTTISQVMQVFPEPALDEFDIVNEKIQGYILHESDIVRGLVNYAYQSVQQNDIAMDLSTFGTDAVGYTDFRWNPDGVPTIPGVPDMSYPMNIGVDFTIDMTTRLLTIKPEFHIKILQYWANYNGAGNTSVVGINKPIEFTILGGALNGQKFRAFLYDSGIFNDIAQQIFLRQYSAVDPFIQRLCALQVALDIIKFWIKPLYMVDNSANIAGTAFSESEKLPGWDDMQKRLENAIKDMMDAIKKWGIKDGRVGDGRGMNPENPALLRSIYIGTAVRGSGTSSPTEYSPFMGWDDPFLFERPDRTTSLGDAMMGYTGRGFKVW